MFIKKKNNQTNKQKQNQITTGLHQLKSLPEQNSVVDVVKKLRSALLPE